MSDDTNDQQKPDREETRDGTQREDDQPKVKRKSLSSDPTMPIRLDRSLWKKPQQPLPGANAPTELTNQALPEIEAPKPASVPAAAETWDGKEMTLVGAPPPAPPTAKVKIASMDEGEDWLGREGTMVGITPTTSPAAEQEAKDWVGSEATAIGMPVPKMTPPGATAGEEEWVGREATMLGIDAKGGSLTIETAGDKKEKSRTGSGTRGTSPTLDDGWHLKGRQGPLTGKAIGDYEVGGILGEGGMGTVYRARQISLKRRVALKVLPPNLSHDQNLRTRFEAEARTASLLNTPHVVQVFAAGAQDDTVYFVMEYVEGTDLSSIISDKKDRNEKFTGEEACGYVLQAARGLAEAGKHQIVHRDIKPPNLMVTSKGVVKIADFGISKVTGEHGLTMTGTAVGTPAYCSPEQGRGDLVDGRADIYSLGVVFFELLTGQKPFDGTTANALIYQHNYAEPPLPTTLNPDVSEQYQAVVMKCLQKDPAKRYQDASELVTDLERIRDGNMSLTAVFSAKFGTGADEAMSRYLGVKKRRMWPMVAAGLVVLGGGGGGWYWYTERSEVRRLQAEEIASLRLTLVKLDNAQPIPDSAASDIEKLAKIRGNDDPDVKRYAGKLAKVRELEARLGRLDALDAVPAALRAESERDLDAYVDLVGKGSTSGSRWTAKLEASRAEAAELRRALAEIDAAPAMTAALRERLDPGLSRLRTIAGEADSDVARWTQKFTDFQERLAAMRTGLGALDAADALITEGQVARLTADLEALRAALGQSDKDADRWADGLTKARARIERLRRNLARIDSGEHVTSALLAALKGDLDEYQKLVDAGDPELKRWLGRVRESQAFAAQLREGLAPLDQPDQLQVSEHAGLQTALDRLRGLAGDEDQQVKGWSRKLSGARDRVTALRSTLTRLEQEAALKVEEQDACEKALASLDAIGGLSAEQKRFFERRLSEERARVRELREELAAKAASNQNVSAELVARIELLASLVGEQDPDVKQWRGRVADYQRLRTLLSPLDEAAAIPARAEQLLDDFARIVGDADGKVIAWRAKVARVTTLRQGLSPLDQVVALPADARSGVTELTRLVGGEEADVKRWTAKVERVGALRAVLTVELRDAYVLPSQAPKRCAELISLIGTTEEDVRRWAVRIGVLQGPPQPSWATRMGRDQYGPWADLTVKGVTQRLRYVPKGSFVMGSPDAERDRDRDEPRVRVTLTQSFWMADSECAQGFFEAVAGSHGSRFRGADKPVDRISWEDCQRFLVTLNGQLPRLSARLPTEAEWEYACRAGVDGAWSSYTGPVEESKLESVGWFARNAGGGTKDVKRRFPNPLGLHDMHGNLWEWCKDRFGTYSPTPIEDPEGREEENRVARGGSWGDQPKSLRAANRLSVKPGMRTVYIGFRIAAPAEWPAGQEPGQGAIAIAPTEHAWQPVGIEDEQPLPEAPLDAAPVEPPAAPETAPAPAPVTPSVPAPVTAGDDAGPMSARFTALLSADRDLGAAVSDARLVVIDGEPVVVGRAATREARERLGLAAVRAADGARVRNHVTVGAASAPAAPATPVEAAPAAPPRADAVEPAAAAPAVAAPAAVPGSAPVPAAAPPVAAAPAATSESVPVPADTAERAAPAPAAPAADERLAVMRSRWSEALGRDAALATALAGVELTLEDGQPTLSGRVPTAAARARANVVAFQALGGVRVRNRLEVAPPAAAPAAAAAAPSTAGDKPAVEQPAPTVPAAAATPAAEAPAPAVQPAPVAVDPQLAEWRQRWSAAQGGNAELAGITLESMSGLPVLRGVVATPEARNRAGLAAVRALDGARVINLVVVRSEP